MWLNKCHEGPLCIECILLERAWHMCSKRCPFLEESHSCRWFVKCCAVRLGFNYYFFREDSTLLNFQSEHDMNVRMDEEVVHHTISGFFLQKTESLHTDCTYRAAIVAERRCWNTVEWIFCKRRHRLTPHRSWPIQPQLKMYTTSSLPYTCNYYLDDVCQRHVGLNKKKAQEEEERS